MAASEQPRGDPSFQGDERITHEPVVEQERESPLPEREVLRRPFPWAVTAVVLAFAGTATVAVVAAGGSYVIPFLVVAGLTVGFVVTHWLLSRRSTARYPEGRAQDLAAADSEDSVPSMGFDERTALGASSEQSESERAAHADPNQSTGRS